MENLFEQRKETARLNEVMEEVKKEIGKVVVGQHNMVELLLISLLCDGHVLIEGVPGVAKTLTAKLLSRLIDADFSRIQFTPDLMPSDVLGTSVYSPVSARFEFKQGPIFSNIILIDEINRAPAKTQAALFEVMEEKQVTIDGISHPMDSPFMVLATQNPIEHEGTYRLPEAQLDRFLFKIVVDYPSFDEELEFLKSQQSTPQNELLRQVRQLIHPAQLQEYRGWINEVVVDDALIALIAKLVGATRTDASFYLGASPRASLAILKASRANAAIRGRDFVTPDDIREMAIPVLRHRVILTPEKEMEGVSADDVLQQLLNSMEVPR